MFFDKKKKAIEKNIQEYGTTPGKMAWESFRSNKLAVFGLILFTFIVLACIFGPMISPYGRDAMDYNAMNQGPTAAHWAGTDNLGRDYFTRILYGGRISLVVGVGSVIITIIIAIIVGGVSGYFGGWIDNLLMRFTEIIASLPFLPLVITVSAVTGDRIPPDKKIYMVMILLGVLGWPGLSRMIRAEILSLKEQEFMHAATALGISNTRKIFVHLIPNTIGYIVVNATFGMAGNIITESSLSYLGLGVTPPVPTWGNLILSANDPYNMKKRLWLWVIPGVVLFLAILSINLIGEGLRDAFDPKSRG